MVAHWRHLDDDFGNKVDSLSFSGPAVVFNFRW